MAVEELEEREQQDEEVPELLELIDEVETTSDLSETIQKIGRRLRATPDDRDLLSDFEGINQICESLSKAHWRGEAMLSFCRIMPEVCRTSLVNRGSLRDAGFLIATVKMLQDAQETKDEARLLAGCISIAAMCTANDANKQVAAHLIQEKSVEDSDETPLRGAIFILMDVLESFPQSVHLQAEAMAALRSLVVDDDNRKSECMPSALENREVLLTEEMYQRVRTVLQETSQIPGQSVKLTEQTLLLLREIARGQERIQELAKPSSKLLPYVRNSLASTEARLVRAALSVLRAFAFCEDVRDELSLSCETKGYVEAVRTQLAAPVVCEQGFGLLANLTLRNPAMASFLNDADHQIISLGQLVLQKHTDRPDVAKSVIQLFWSVSRQNPKALAEVRESEMFLALRKLVADHQEDQRWHSAVEVTRQFLREFREDDGVQKKPVYNEFY
ncbi:unnamed protein product [Durusdinium trenchii]|uniref:Uncharacterized protein n=2 Tax=Durusdinium trenchii TaxID=1381693 RepID=A0ABP0NE12_9DINO